MAESVECVITIKVDEDATKKKGVTAASGANGEEIGAGDTSSGNKGKIAAIAAYGYAKRAVMTVWDYNVSTVALRTGRERFQERQEFAKRAISFGISMVEGAVSGLALSGGNPVGALVGVAVSATYKAVELGVERAKFDMQRTVDNIGLAQANIRAGAGSDRIGKNTY